MDPDRDIELMLRVAGGDEEAFAALFDRYHRPLARFLFLCVHDQGLAEDYVQEVFERLWRYRERYQPTGKFTTYLFQIAKNYFLNQREKRMRRPDEISLDRERQGRAGESFVQQHEQAGLAGMTPVEGMLHGELGGKIAEALETLPDKHQMVFRLAMIECLKYADIAAICAIPEGTVKSRMSKATRLLQEKLGRYLEPEG